DVIVDRLPPLRPLEFYKHVHKYPKDEHHFILHFSEGIQSEAIVKNGILTYLPDMTINVKLASVEEVERDRAMNAKQIPELNDLDDIELS
ncbi:MAG: hypothetical protein PXY39_14660, partial [archaeon]|nr:hypothetical protein [archaeon]